MKPLKCTFKIELAEGVDCAQLAKLCASSNFHDCPLREYIDKYGGFNCPVDYVKNLMCTNVTEQTWKDFLEDFNKEIDDGTEEQGQS